MVDLSYDVVVSTLNRPAALATCLRMIEGQTVRPRRVIVVDASDDHESVRDAVMRGRSAEIDWEFCRSPERSLPYQRNYGIALVRSPVVILPDDDSLLYPQTAAALLRAYAQDPAPRIAGVSGMAAPRAPGSTSGDKAASRVVKDAVEPLRNAVERRLVPKPFETFAHDLWRTRDVPGWVTAPYALVETIGGFLLSLRSDIIRRERFDETLGYGIGYALHEDMELSLRLQRLGYLLVAAHDAPIFHDVHPSRRAGGFNYGFCWIANYLYAACRNIPRTSAAFTSHLPRFLAYKQRLYQVRAAVRRDQYSRDVLAGARDALRQRDRLMGASFDELPSVYRQLCDEFVRS